jgi:hypothetical protein
MFIKCYRELWSSLRFHLVSHFQKIVEWRRDYEFKVIFWEFHRGTSPILTIIWRFEFAIRNKAKSIGYNNICFHIWECLTRCTCVYVLEWFPYYVLSILSNRIMCRWRPLLPSPRLPLKCDLKWRRIVAQDSLCLIVIK